MIGLFYAAGVGAFFATNVNDFRQFGRCLDGDGGDQAREACAEQLGRNLDRWRRGTLRLGRAGAAAELIDKVGIRVVADTGGAIRGRRLARTFQ